MMIIYEILGLFMFTLLLRVRLCLFVLDKKDSIIINSGREAVNDMSETIQSTD